MLGAERRDEGRKAVRAVRDENPSKVSNSVELCRAVSRLAGIQPPVSNPPWRCGNHFVT
jgi:hypothetical protein